jgi:hypothetical protein
VPAVDAACFGLIALHIAELGDRPAARFVSPEARADEIVRAGVEVELHLGVDVARALVAEHAANPGEVTHVDR